jgi:hypothetical protein
MDVSAISRIESSDSAKEMLGAMFRIAVQLCVTFAPGGYPLSLDPLFANAAQNPGSASRPQDSPLESADTRPHLPTTGAIHLNRRSGSSMLARKRACSALRRCEAHSAIAERIALSGGITPCS